MPEVWCQRLRSRAAAAGHSQQVLLTVDTYLRVNEQRPAAGLADDDGVVNGEAVVGQALDDPLPDLHGFPKHSCHAEVCRAGDVVPLTL